MVSKYVDVEVEVNLEDFSDEQLIEEFELRHGHRGLPYVGDMLTTIWMKKRLGKPYDDELDQLIYHKLGHII